MKRTEFIIMLLLGLNLMWSFFSANRPETNCPASKEVVKERVVLYVNENDPVFNIGQCIQEEEWEAIWKVEKVGKKNYFLISVKVGHQNLYKPGEKTSKDFMFSKYYSMVDCP